MLEKSICILKMESLFYGCREIAFLFLFLDRYDRMFFISQISEIYDIMLVVLCIFRYNRGGEKMKKDVLKIEEVFPFENGMRIVIGCSGGPDSMALFDMLLKIRRKYQLSLICAHVNHNLRKESIEEEAYLREFCKEHQVVYQTMTIEKYGEDNFHNEARTIRYHFFEDVVHHYQADILMTAHHADDLMETILMRITRGSNLRGYSGFHLVVQKSDYKIVRPLIHFTKKELEDYNLSHHVPYFIDRSNLSSKYTRNRYRREVLPFLKKEDIHVHEKFLKFSEVLMNANTYLEKEVLKAYQRVTYEGELSISLFLKEDKFIQREILYLLLAKFYQDDLILVSDRHIDLLYRLITSKRANLTYNLPNEVVVVKSYDVCYLERKPDFLSTYEIEFESFADLPNGHVIEKIADTPENSNFICRLDSREVQLPLIIRTRKIGDKMTIKGLNGTKKLKDIFINSKVDAKKREFWPVVVDASGKIVWLPGLKKSKFNKTKSESYDIIMKYR